MRPPPRIRPEVARFSARSLPDRLFEPACASPSPMANMPPGEAERPLSQPSPSSSMTLPEHNGGVMYPYLHRTPSDPSIRDQVPAIVERPRLDCDELLHTLHETTIE